MEQLESRIRHLEAENEILRIHSLECITPNKNIMDVLKDSLDKQHKEMRATVDRFIESCRSDMKVDTELVELHIENEGWKIGFSNPFNDHLVSEFEFELRQDNEKKFQTVMKNIERLWLSAEQDDELKSQMRFDAVVTEYWQWKADRGVKRKHACVEVDSGKPQV
jgi:hypothetical protein